jgi:hypothetical protein
LIDSGWAEYLGALEARLEIAEVGLLAGVLAIEPFAPPEGLGPLPAEYEAWAAAVLARNNALEASLVSESSKVVAAMADARRRRTPGVPARPAYFDQSV